MRFPMNTNHVEGTSPGKQFQLNVITSLNFQGSFIFGEATFSHFFMVTTQRQQLLFQGCYFFRADAFFQDLRFLKTVTSLKQLFFPEYLLFWSKTSTQQPLLENMKLFRAITFRNSYIFGGAIVQNKEIYRRASFLKQVFPHTISFFRRGKFSKKLVFQKRNIPHYLLLLESYLFRVATFE